MIRAITILVGVGVGVGLAACGGDTVVYKTCDDPGPHRFIESGTYHSSSQKADALEDAPPIANPAPKTLIVDDSEETLEVRYELADGLEVVETWMLTNKRSTEN